MKRATGDANVKIITESMDLNTPLEGLASSSSTPPPVNSGWKHPKYPGDDQYIGKRKEAQVQGLESGEYRSKCRKPNYDAPKSIATPKVGAPGYSGISRSQARAPQNGDPKVPRTTVKDWGTLVAAEADKTTEYWRKQCQFLVHPWSPNSHTKVQNKEDYKLNIKYVISSAALPKVKFSIVCTPSVSRELVRFDPRDLELATKQMFFLTLLDPVTEFHLFPNLPIELRLMVWKLALLRKMKENLASSIAVHPVVTDHINAPYPTHPELLAPRLSVGFYLSKKWFHKNGNIYTDLLDVSLLRATKESRFVFLEHFKNVLRVPKFCSGLGPTLPASFANSKDLYISRYDGSIIRFPDTTFIAIYDFHIFNLWCSNTSLDTDLLPDCFYAIKRLHLSISVFRQELDMSKLIRLFVNLERLLFSWDAGYLEQSSEIIRFNEFIKSMEVYKKENPECKHPQISTFEAPPGWQ